MKIMVVDDERDVLESVGELLSSHEVELFQDPIQALKRYEKSNEFDYIIVDHRMPRKHGEGFIFDIKYMNPYQKIILMTAHLDEVKLPAHFGVMKFEKPASITQILDSLKAA